MTKQTNEKGFTIIEVVLVLAIAGLIFLIVFLALPQLQRSRRDTQRQNDAGRAIAALESYAGNNAGEYPDQDDFDDFVGNYLINDGGVWDDPSEAGDEAGRYDIVTTRPTESSNSLSAGDVYYDLGEVCEGQWPDDTNADSRNVVVVVFQESGATYCQDNR